MGFFTDEQTGKLNEKLNPALVKTREQSGIKLSYIDGYTAIKHANEIFGYGNWESKIKDLRQIELATITKETRSGTREGWRASYICIHEITVYGANGESRTFSDVGFGSGVSYSSPGDAVESAVKEAATDALKRTLRFFGPQFGLDLYSEDERREQGLDGRSNGTVKRKAKPVSTNSSAKPSGGSVTWEDVVAKYKALSPTLQAKATPKMAEIAKKHGHGKLADAGEAAWKEALEFLNSL